MIRIMTSSFMTHIMTSSFIIQLKAIDAADQRKKGIFEEKNQNFEKQGIWPEASKQTKRE